MHQEDIIFKVKLATSRGGNLTKNAHSRAVYYYESFFFFFFFAHLIVFLHILLFFCTSYCFAHIIVLHFFYFIAHFTLISLFLPYICSCVVLLYIIFSFIILHCPLSGPDSITFHF